MVKKLVNPKAAAEMLSALVRKRDRNAVKSGEMEPIIARQRKGNKVTGYQLVDPKDIKSQCPHYTMEYRTDDKTEKTTPVKVWENHVDCLSARGVIATSGGQGTSLPYTGRRKGAGGRKTGVSSFQTHKVVVEPLKRQPCLKVIRKRRDGGVVSEPCGKSSAPNDIYCPRHGGLPRAPKACTAKRVELLPEEMPMLVVDR